MSALMLGLLWTIVLPFLDAASTALRDRTVSFGVASTTRKIIATNEPPPSPAVGQIEDVRTTTAAHLFQILTTVPAASRAAPAVTVTVLPPPHSSLSTTTRIHQTSTSIIDHTEGRPLRSRSARLVGGGTTSASFVAAAAVSTTTAEADKERFPSTNSFSNISSRHRFRKPPPIMFSDMEMAYSRASTDELFTNDGLTPNIEPVKFPRFDDIQRRVGGADERPTDVMNRRIFGDPIIHERHKFAKLFTEILQNSDAMQRALQEGGGPPPSIPVPPSSRPALIPDSHRQPQNALYHPLVIRLPARPGFVGHDQKVLSHFAASTRRPFSDETEGGGRLNVTPPKTATIMPTPPPSPTDRTMDCCSKAVYVWQPPKNNVAAANPIPTASPCARNQPMAETNESRDGCGNHNNDPDLLDRLIERIAQRESERERPTARRWHSARGGAPPPFVKNPATTRRPFNDGGGVQQTWQSGCEQRAPLFHGIGACTTSVNDVDNHFNVNAMKSSSYTASPYQGGGGYSCGKFNYPPNSGDKFYAVDSITNSRNGFPSNEFTNPFYQTLPDAFSPKRNNRLIGGVVYELFPQHALSIADASADVLMNYLYESHRSRPMAMDGPYRGR